VHKIIHLEQTGRNCGQTCVAMLTGMSIDEVACRIGKSGPTHYKDLLKILRKTFHVRDLVLCRREPFSPYAGQTHLCRVRYPHPRYWSHWIVIDNNAVFDPSAPRKLQFRDWQKGLPEGAHITSYVILSKKLVAMPDPKPMLEQLQQLACRVVWDGDLISKQHRTQLVLEGLADRIHGYNFITRKGIEYLRSVDLMPDVTIYRLIDSRKYMIVRRDT
jgi:hypothetical protein